MKQVRKQKRLLKKEVFERLETYDWSMYHEVNDEIDGIITECGEKLSKLLSEYYLNWDSIKFQRDEIVLDDLPNEFPDIINNELRKLIVQYIKDYWNSKQRKKGYGEFLSDNIELIDEEH